MSFPDDHVTCPSCKAVVPWSPACINCGEKLPPQQPKEDLFAALEDALSDENLQPESDEEPTLPTMAPEEEPEGRLAQLLQWRVKILEMAEKREIGHDVFIKLYNEYMEKTRTLVEQYADHNDKANEAYEILVDTKALIEEKQRQRDIGTITAEEFLSEFNRLRNIIEKIENSINRLRMQQKTMGIGGSTEKDSTILKGIHRKLHHYKSILPLMVTNQNIPQETEETLRNDLEQMLKMLEATVDAEFEEPVLDIPEPEIVEEEQIEDDAIFVEITKIVKGHDDEIRRLLRAIRIDDNILLLGPHGEGKTETLLQLQRLMGGIYFHCNEEVTERELVGGYNPSAFVGKEPVHNGLLMQVILNEDKEAPIVYIDAVMKLRPKTQVILFEAMNNKTFTNPVDGKTYRLPEDFCVVAASNLESVVQDTPDPAFLDRFGKTILWSHTPTESIQSLLARYALPEHIFNYVIWIKTEVDRMRYLVPISVRNILKFAREYQRYKEVYQDPYQLKQLAVDRLLKIRVLNSFGIEEYQEARHKVLNYEW